MRFIIPLSLVASFGFISCQEEAKVVDEGPDETQVELVALKAELARLENQLVTEQNDRLVKDAEQAAVFSELASVMRSLKETSEPRMIEVPVEKVGVPAVNEEEDHAEERRVSRLKAEGEELVYLKTNKGDEYHELVINRVTDIGVVFRHRGGIARIPFGELPVAWQDRFYYDRDRALLALKVERAAQVRYDRAVAASLEELENKEARVEIDQSLQRLAGAVEDLQRQAAVNPQQGPLDGGIFVDQPIILHDQRFFQNGVYCPPIIHPPILRNPVVRTPLLQVPTIRSGNSGQLQRPTPLIPTPRPTPTVQRPGSRVTGSSTTRTRPRIITRPSTPTPTPTIRRPASRSRSTATPIPRSRPTSVPRRSSPAPVRRSTPSVSRSRSTSSAPTRSRSTPARPVSRR